MPKGLFPLVCQAIMKPKTMLAYSEVIPTEFNGAYSKEASVGSPVFWMDTGKAGGAVPSIPFRLCLQEF